MMAENKKSFILYSDLIHVIKKLVEDDRKNNTNNGGELFLHILSYVNDEEPIPLNMIIDISFEPIKQQLKRDLVKWVDTSLIRSEIGRLGGLKSGESRRKKLKQNEANEANEAIASKLKQNEHDNDNDNDNDNEIKKERIFSEKEIQNKKYLPLAKKLSKIIQINKNTKYSLKIIKQWSNEIRLLSSTKGVSYERIDIVLDWYAENIGFKYTPQVESGSSLRSKFEKLEVAIQRDNAPVKNNQPNKSLVRFKSPTKKYNKPETITK